MISELLALTQNEGVAGFFQVFLGVAAIGGVIYAVRAILRPASPVRATALPVPRKSPPARGRTVPSIPLPRATPESHEVQSRLHVLKMTADAHWQRAVAPMQLSVARGHRARDLHQRAAMRLGSADYAFDRMLEELSLVIALPARGAVTGRFEVPALAMAHPASLAA